MKTPEEYRAKAAEAARQAANAIDPGLREAYLQIVEAWREIAEEAASGAKIG
jgi:hypothetical protein